MVVTLRIRCANQLGSKTLSWPYIAAHVGEFRGATVLCAKMVQNAPLGTNKDRMGGRVGGGGGGDRGCRATTAVAHGSQIVMGPTHYMRWGCLRTAEMGRTVERGSGCAPGRSTIRKPRSP